MLSEHAQRSIEICKEKIRILESEISLWETSKSDLTDEQAYKICKKLDDSFATSLVKNPLDTLSPKQFLWMHIIANRNLHKQFTTHPSTTESKLKYKKKYTFTEVSTLVECKKMFIKRVMVGTTPSYLISDTKCFKDALQFMRTSEIVKFLTDGDLTHPCHAPYGIK